MQSKVFKSVVCKQCPHIKTTVTLVDYSDSSGHIAINLHFGFIAYDSLYYGL